MVLSYEGVPIPLPHYGASLNAVHPCTLPLQDSANLESAGADGG